MASLVEELINVLTEEEKVYRTLAANGEKKRQIIIDADIPALEAITDLDQQAGDELLIMSNKQVSLLTDIANVLGKSDEKMTVTRLIGYLGTQPDIQAKLTAARDSLIEAAAQMKEINDLNSQLLAQAIELTEFDITLFKSMKQAPETANYDRNAYNTGDILGSSGLMQSNIINREDRDMANGFGSFYVGSSGLKNSQNALNTTDKQHGQCTIRQAMCASR